MKSESSLIVILYPGCIFFEIALAVELLSKKYRIIFTTPDGADHIASNGAVIRANSSYQAIDLSGCKAILVPGGDPGSIKENSHIDQLIQAANTEGLWIAAICAGPSILAKANILKGKKIAHGYGPQQLEFLKSYFSGVELTNEKFVCDKNILTAKPEAHIDFAIEIACRLKAADASKANRLKDYYRGVLGTKIRPLALAIIQNHHNQFLFHKGYDRIKNETFYRPLGGGIEFGETGTRALQREIMEELNQEVIVSGLTASFENIFTFEGKTGHEIIMLFSTSFKNRDSYSIAELDIYERGVVISKAVWRSLDEIKTEGAKLFPNGIAEVLR